jgi:hypothetical protein
MDFHMPRLVPANTILESVNGVFVRSQTTRID